jgi:hypothetical protein
MKKTLQQNNLTIAKADMSKAIVIINKNKLKHKIDAFIQKKSNRYKQGPNGTVSEADKTSNPKMQRFNRQKHT